MYMIFLLLLLFIIITTWWDQGLTQGLVLAKQVLYHLSHSSSTLLLFRVENSSPETLGGRRVSDYMFGGICIYRMSCPGDGTQICTQNLLCFTHCLKVILWTVFSFFVGDGTGV
jgi:hypothetical protein